MKKWVAIALIAAHLAVPVHGATGSFDVRRARGSIDNAVSEIVSKPAFDWSEWLDRILEGWM